jgi:hypothetical protein
MNAAERRLVELLDRWQASIDRHAGYLDLDDASYAKVQQWPRHQRPTRWVVDLARARLRELQQQVDERRKRDDTAFAESLELMAFLTTLLGSEHVERFIPYAAPAEPVTAAKETPPATAPRVAATPRPAPPRAAQAPVRAQAGKPSTSAAKPARQHDKPPKPDKLAATVIADAARLLSWGREWPQLAGLIARLADRPPEPQVWEILRTYRSVIEAKARRIPD